MWLGRAHLGGVCRCGWGVPTWAESVGGVGARPLGDLRMRSLRVKILSILSQAGLQLLPFLLCYLLPSISHYKGLLLYLSSVPLL